MLLEKLRNQTNKKKPELKQFLKSKQQEIILSEIKISKANPYMIAL